MRHHPPRARTSQGGAISMEFVVTFATVLTLLMGLLQVAHGYVARIMVTSAAERAARAAAVWSQEVAIGQASQQDVVEHATAAAALALTPISPPIGRTTGRGAKAPPFVQASQSVGAGQQAAPQAFAGWSADRALDADTEPRGRPMSKLAYAFHATQVEVQGGGAGSDRVKVHLEYAYYCPFPFANVLYGLTLGEAGSAGGESWASRLIQGGAPNASRVRIIKADQEHFASPEPQG